MCSPSADVGRGARSPGTDVGRGEPSQSGRRRGPPAGLRTASVGRTAAPLGRRVPSAVWCCMVRVACCMLHVACCIVFRVRRWCCKLHVARCTLHVACCMLHLLCCMLHRLPCAPVVLQVACCTLHAASSMLHAASSSACAGGVASGGEAARLWYCVPSCARSSRGRLRHKPMATNASTDKSKRHSNHRPSCEAHGARRTINDRRTIRRSRKRDERTI
jgi:hypothetical protein